MGLKLASRFDVSQQTDVDRGDRVQHKRKNIFFLKKALGIEISRNDEENSGIT